MELHATQLAWPDREAARGPMRFRDRIVAQFRSPDNISYLRALFAQRVPAGAQRAFALNTLQSAANTFSSGEGRAYEVIGSDPVARRGSLRPAVDIWSEVRRLNRAFYVDRLAAVRDNTNHLGGSASRDGIAADEPYHMRMFVADSLRPPGLEHLNTPGPLYAIREDQATAPRRDAPDVFMYGDDDAPWRSGDPDRTPEEALAEYWGDSCSASETTVGAADGRAYGDTAAWGSTWQENGGTRFMRREQIPFWQKGGRGGYDDDIEDTLGTASRELGGHVRRWDLDRVRSPRGQEYRHFGSR
jgi:hypothetical protein